MKKKILSILVCLVVISPLVTGCKESNTKDDVKKDMVEYLNNKYNKSFDVNITKTFGCSGGIGTCEYHAEAYIKDDSSKKCTVKMVYEEYSDDCDTIVK